MTTETQLKPNLLPGTTQFRRQSMRASPRVLGLVALLLFQYANATSVMMCTEPSPAESVFPMLS